MLRFKGMAELHSNLRKVQRRLEAVGGAHEVSFSELFSEAFMRQHTQFGSFEAMVEASPFDVSSPQDFAAIPDAAWDAFVRKTTSFQGWADMKKQAAAKWVGRKLDFR